MFIDKKMKKFEYSITGNDVVPQNMTGDIFLGHPVIFRPILTEILRVLEIGEKRRFKVCSFTATRYINHASLATVV
jgi:hypothetical protein